MITYKKSIAIALLLTALNLDAQKIQVFKPIASTCPQNWLEDMKELTNEVEIVNLKDVKRLKHEMKIPYELRSCNTSIMDDYIFEGNVPKEAMKEFLKNPVKDALGLSLPASENLKKEKTVYILFKNNTYKVFGKYK
ncbi:MAG: DUF411 domain-containing protein [Halarcobacter sp.]